ncbi:MAG: LicD family protein [Bacteroidales bacterium]|jgi:lipopolysaccharide cholinephosphotransferase|nr:LicD family protein [Bacteroidales bacterium]
MNLEMSNEFVCAFKKCLIETMKVFITFCAENNIRYFCTGGTAIGAIRHKGFIPWDDDIDVCMLREDYDRFMSLRSKCNGSGYAIIDYHDKGNPAPYGKFVNMNTTLVETDCFPYSSGIFIDVFPLDNVKNDLEETKRIKEKVMSDMKLYQSSAYDLSWSEVFKYLMNGHLNSVRKVLQSKCIYQHQFAKLSNMLEENENVLRNINGDRVLNYYTFYKIEKEIFPKEWFSGTIEVPFEDIRINLPVGYHEYLSKLFGDYMTLPPVDKQVSHHSQYYCNLREHLSIEEIRRRLSKGEVYVM